MNRDDTMHQAPPLLEVKNLIIHYETEDGVVEAVNNVSFKIRKGETFGLIGETGAGKTTIALSLMRLLPEPPSHIVSGSVYFNGEDIYRKHDEEVRSMRGKSMGMIFQDPMTALNPVMRVGEQIAECISLHSQGLHRDEVVKEAKKMLRTVGIPEERYEDYPHQFSGGMKQRVVIAMALACSPELIIADEPTTALDVTIQAQVLALMKNLQDTLDTSMLIITHDFGVVAEVCDHCAVMYAGEIVEVGTIEDIFDDPRHPYTIGLFNSLPSLRKESSRLKPIKGIMPDPMDLPEYCTFAARCDHCTERCRQGDPALHEVSPGHYVKCFRVQDKEGE